MVDIDIYVVFDSQLRYLTAKFEFTWLSFQIIDMLLEPTLYI